MNKSSDINKIFKIIYILCLSGAGIIGLLSGSFFAYEIFDSLWADILYIIFVLIFFVTAFVHEMLSSHKTADIIFNAAVFIGGGIFCAVSFFIGGVSVFFMLLLSAVLMCVLLFRLALRARSEASVVFDIKPFIGIGALLLFSVTSMMTVNFVDNMYVVWALIPAFIVTAIIALVAVILLRGVFLKLFVSKAKCVGSVLCFMLLTSIISFSYSFTALGLANCVFDAKAPECREYIVLDKQASSGTHSMSEYNIKVRIDGKEKSIRIPAADYHSLSEGDSVVLKYYTGACGFPYYKYDGKSPE